MEVRMGRIFQAYYTKKGVYEKDGQGRTVLSDEGTPQLKRFFTKGFCLEYTDVVSRTIHRKGGLTREAAKDALRKAEADVLREKNGLPARRAGEILCNQLREEYLTSQKRLVSPKHYDNLQRQIEAVLIGMRAVHVRDLRGEIDVLSRVTRVHVDVMLAPATVPPGRADELRGYDYNGGRLCEKFLVVRRGCDLPGQVAGLVRIKCVLIRKVLVDARGYVRYPVFGRKEEHVERIARSRARRNFKLRVALFGSARAPEQGGDFIGVQRAGSEFAPAHAVSH